MSEENDAGGAGSDPRRIPETPGRRSRKWPLVIALVVLAAIVLIVLRPYCAPPAEVAIQ